MAPLQAATAGFLQLGNYAPIMVLLINLAQKSNLPAYQQIADSLRQAIIEGRLGPGEMLPSTRDLAASLKLSRPTVKRSYAILISEGYLEAETGAGTFVSRNVLDRSPPQPAPLPAPADNHVEAHLPELSSFGKYLSEFGNAEAVAAEVLSESLYGVASQDQIPIRIWRQLLLKHCRFAGNPSSDLAGDPLGYPKLREAMSGYLSRFRGVRCSADQIATFIGFSQGLDLVSRVLINRGDWVAVENPGYRGARRTFTALGARLQPIPADEQGMIVSELAKMEQKFKLVYVVPSHHDPTGVVMSRKRRHELLEWATRTGTLIFEDDYDSEYRYGAELAPSLQGLSNGELVIYATNLKKVLFPVEGLTFHVYPPSLLQTFKCVKSTVARELPLLQQCALADFISDGYLERHILRTRPIYAKRLQAMVKALTGHFGRAVTIARESGGMHLLVKFRFSLLDNQIEMLAHQAGIELISSASYYAGDPVVGEFLVPFAALDETIIENRVSQMAEFVRDADRA